MRVVIFVGGEGTRLRPFTEELPKPLLPVGRKPILQTIIEQLRRHGLTSICLATRYKAELIESYFGDGGAFGVDLSYTREPLPLGTAGALRLARDGHAGPLMAINGDLLTNVSFRGLCASHDRHQADVTVAVKRHDVPLRFGVVDVSNGEVTGFREKPVLELDVYAGIAILEPWVVELVPPNTRYDVPDLIDDVKQEGGKIRPYWMTEFWLDIGERADYAKANELVGGWEEF